MAARKCTSRVKSKGQPYAGIGGGYLVILGNISDGILTNFSVDQNFAFVVQGGADSVKSVSEPFRVRFRGFL